MTGMDEGTYVAECFWPGVSEHDLSALDERTQACVAELSRGGENVRYLGSLLLRADEVVLCRFEGDDDAVREMVEWVRRGPSQADVTDVDVTNERPEGLGAFSVR